MIYLRSAAFNVAFYLNLAVLMIGGLWLFALPRKPLPVAGLKLWSRTSRWWLEKCATTRVEVRGWENIPSGAALVAGKHQSAFDTFALFDLFDDPAIVMKKELMWLPLLGWYCRKLGHIPIDRGSGAPALRALLRHALAATGEDRQIIIFPEGTRRAPGAPPDYKPGAAALYTRLGVPCVPFALNSGLFWPRRGFLRYPGTITIEFLPPLPPGLPRKVFEQKLRDAIEPAARRLAQHPSGGNAGKD